jgi:hypothetical protein
MPNFADPAHQQRAWNASLAKRRAFAEVKCELKAGRMPLGKALTHLVCLERPVADVLPYAFRRRDTDGSSMIRSEGTALKVRKRLNIPEATLCRDLTLAQRFRLTGAVKRQGLCAERHPVAEAA